MEGATSADTTAVATVGTIRHSDHRRQSDNDELLRGMLLGALLNSGRNRGGWGGGGFGGGGFGGGSFGGGGSGGGW